MFKIWKSEGRPREKESKAYTDHKRAKKEFLTAIKKVSKNYENAQMIEAIESNSGDRSIF